MDIDYIFLFYFLRFGDDFFNWDPTKIKPFIVDFSIPQNQLRFIWEYFFELLNCYLFFFRELSFFFNVNSTLNRFVNLFTSILWSYFCDIFWSDAFNHNGNYTHRWFKLWLWLFDGWLCHNILWWLLTTHEFITLFYIFEIIIIISFLIKLNTKLFIFFNLYFINKLKKLIY